MPGAERLIRAYGLNKFARSHGLTFSLIDMDETTVKKNREYNYKYTLQFTSTKPLTDIDTTNFAYNLKHHLSGEKIVKSAYGNPYECHLYLDKDVTRSRDKKRLTFTVTGDSERIFETESTTQSSIKNRRQSRRTNRTLATKSAKSKKSRTTASRKKSILKKTSPSSRSKSKSKKSVKWNDRASRPSSSRTRDVDSDEE